MKATRPTLIIVGHGSSSARGAEEAIEDHARTLRLSPRFSAVHTYFLRGEKPLPDLPEGEVFILPFFMSDGYFVKTKVPELFGLKNFVRKTESTALYQCEALGIDPDLSHCLLSMATNAAAQNNLQTSATAVLLIAHGSGNNPASAAAAALQRDRLQKIANFQAIDIAFLEQTPKINDTLDSLSKTADAIICLGLFAADGPHAKLDVPTEIAAWQHRSNPKAPKAVQIYNEGVVGTQPEIVKLIQSSVSRCAAKYAAPQ